ncbi:MAG: hypothetical protein IKN91_02625 [Paludibacteraceae bacterium]|nr:hypothetical protein [Paludibacteraceae bacterium]
MNTQELGDIFAIAGQPEFREIDDDETLSEADEQSKLAYFAMPKPMFYLAKDETLSEADEQRKLVYFAMPKQIVCLVKDE